MDEEIDEEARKKTTVTRKRPAGKNGSMSASTIAALAVGGVVVGALTAGVGLVAGMVVVGIGAAAGGGAAAMTQGGKAEKEKFLTLACDSYVDAERWTHAIETQIRELADSMYDLPLVRGTGTGLTGRNQPPEKKLEFVEQWIRWSKWKHHTILNGIRLCEQDKSSSPTPGSPQSERALDQGVKLLRVNMGMNVSTSDVFITLMNMPPGCLSGLIRSCRVVESMDNQTDIIYMELDSIYLHPTATSEFFFLIFLKFCSPTRFSSREILET